VLDLDADEEKVDLADDDVPKVVPVGGASAHARKQGLKKKGREGGRKRGGTHLLLLYSNSMCRQSSMPTSILIGLLLSGGIRYECTQISFSRTTSAIRRATVTRIK
jgi:hypothetical protein